jgi:precorrin-6A/cobalt-precorrin-6A reductase
MIWVLSGTRDAVEIIKLLKTEGHRVMASAVTDYGASLARDAGANEVVTKTLDCNEMKNVLDKKDIDAVVDATHPFAVKASKNAMLACKKTGMKYVRFERESLKFDDLSVHQLKDFEEAARKACEFGGTIFYAAGSRNVRIFVKSARAKNRRLVARVLPEPSAVGACLDAGLTPADIIAAQGPFSEDMNRTMLREYSASVLVTKESGKAGGLEAKVNAALGLGIPVVLIKRPGIEYQTVANDYDAVLGYL